MYPFSFLLSSPSCLPHLPPLPLSLFLGTPFLSPPQLSSVIPPPPDHTDRTKTDYLDLYLIHWPVRLEDNGSHWLFPTKADGSRNVDWEWKQAQTWKGMEALLETGKVKAIGVSNYSEIALKELKKTWKVVPAVNQVCFMV